MTPETVISAMICAAGVSTAVTLTATLLQLLKRRGALRRDTKLPLQGSARPELDPERPSPPSPDMDQPDADLLVPSLDPDRPLPPPQEDVDLPDMEEAVVNG